MSPARAWDDNILDNDESYADFAAVEDDPSFDDATEMLWDEAQERRPGRDRDLDEDDPVAA